MKSLSGLFTFLCVFIALSYADSLLLGEVRRYDNAVLSAIAAGIVYLIILLTDKSKRPRI